MVRDLVIRSEDINEFTSLRCTARIDANVGR